MVGGSFLGKQIGFLMDEATELEFANYILQSGEILFEGEYQTPQSITSLPARYSVNGWFQLRLYKQEIGDLKLHAVETLGVERINPTFNPVIEFSRSTVRDEEMTIRRGRLWVEMKYWERYNGSDELIEKPKALDDWYKQLCKWIRKHLPMTTVVMPDGGIIKEYMSPAIKAKIEAGYRPTS